MISTDLIWFIWFQVSIDLRCQKNNTKVLLRRWTSSPQVNVASFGESAAFWHGRTYQLLKDDEKPSMCASQRMKSWVIKVWKCGWKWCELRRWTNVNNIHQNLPESGKWIRIETHPLSAWVEASGRCWTCRPEPIGSWSSSECQVRVRERVSNKKLVGGFWLLLFEYVWLLLFKWLKLTSNREGSVVHFYVQRVQKCVVTGCQTTLFHHFADLHNFMCHW